MTNTPETPSINYSPQLEAEREAYLADNDRGYEIQVDEEKARTLAREAFINYTDQIEARHTTA